jgi:hypothetical protein
VDAEESVTVPAAHHTPAATATGPKSDLIWKRRLGTRG